MVQANVRLPGVVHRSSRRPLASWTQAPAGPCTSFRRMASLGSGSAGCQSPLILRPQLGERQTPRSLPTRESVMAHGRGEVTTAVAIGAAAVKAPSNIERMLSSYSAAWSTRSIELGGQSRYCPLVIGSDGIPRITDREQARREPQLAVQREAAIREPMRCNCPSEHASSWFACQRTPDAMSSNSRCSVPGSRLARWPASSKGGAGSLR